MAVADFGLSSLAAIGSAIRSTTTSAVDIVAETAVRLPDNNFTAIATVASVGIKIVIEAAAEVATVTATVATEDIAGTATILRPVVIIIDFKPNYVAISQHSKQGKIN